MATLQAERVADIEITTRCVAVAKTSNQFVYPRSSRSGVIAGTQFGLVGLPVVPKGSYDDEEGEA